MKLKGKEPEQCEIDMTPLIDCVFLLILFFLLTTKMTMDIEEVALPFAIEGEDAETAAATQTIKPLVVNIVLDGSKPREDRAGIIRFDGADLTEKELERKLAREARYDADPKPMGRGRGWERGPEGDLSKLSVLVRADRDVRAEFTRKVFQACSNARIYKVKVGSIEPQ